MRWPRPRLLAPILFILAGVVTADGARLTVSVTNDQGTSIAGADVAAVTFDPITQTPSATLTQIGQTGPDGQLSVSIGDNTPYTIVATVSGHTPTAQAQLNAPDNVPLQGTGDLNTQIILTPGLTRVGQLQAGVTLSNAPGLVMASVTLQNTGVPIAVSMQRFMSTSGSLLIPNVPQAPAGAYILTVFEVQSGRAVSAVVQGELLVGRVLDAGTFDCANAGAVAPLSRSPLGGEGVPSLEGIVKESTAGRPLSEAKVVVVDVNSPQTPPRVGLTDAQGHYAVFGLPTSTYYVVALAAGYEGMVDNGGGSGYPMNAGGRLVRHFDGSTGHNAALKPAGGTVTGVVRWGGQPLPGVQVVIEGDSRFWRGTDRYAGVSAALGEGRQLTAPDGTFTISGLAPGNYVLQVVAPWLAQPYVWNWGLNQLLDQVTGGVASGDDQRLTVAKINGTSWSTSFYNASGDPLTTSWVIDLIGAPHTTPTTNQVTGTLQFPSEVTLLPNRPITILARQVSPAFDDQPAIGTVVIPAQGPVTGRSFAYSLTLPVGGVYVLEVQSADYGMVQQPGIARQVDFTQGSAVTNVDIALAPAGRVVGFVRLPDGSLFRPIAGGTVNDRACQVEADGKTVASSAIADVEESGRFELQGLLPGRYTLKTIGSGQFIWPSAALRDVVVVAGQTTQVECPLAVGVPVRPDVPEAALRLWPGARGGLSVLAVPAGQAVSASQWRAILLGDAAAAEFWPIDATTWMVEYLAPGRYDFYLRYLEEFGPAEDGVSSPYPFCVLLGAAKNVFVSLDSQRSGDPSAVVIPIPGTPMQLAGVRGQLTGRSPFSANDLMLYGQGIFTLLDRAPLVALLGPTGELKALAQAVPPNQSSVLWAWQQAALSGDPARLRALMARFPLAYRLMGVPAGTYTATLVSPSLPPLARLLQVSGVTTWDIALDRDLSQGGQIEGRVLDAVSGQPVAEAWVTLNNRMEDRTARTDANGHYSFEGLIRGISTLMISKSGYALGGAKQSVLEGTVAVETRLVPATGSFAGKVLLQTLPFPVTAPGVKVAAYDDTQNGQDPTGFLPLYTAVTDATGQYTLPGIREGHTYKIAALVSGKAVIPLSRVGGKDPVAGVDLFLRDAIPPVTIRAQPQKGQLVMTITTFKPLKTAPLIEAQHNTLSTTVTGENIWSAALAQFPVGQDIPIKVTLDDGGPTPYTVSGTVNSEELARTQRPLIQEIVMGGTIDVNPDHNDFSGVEIPAGGLTQVAASAAERIARQPLGGALESRPQLRVMKISRQQPSVLASLPSQRVASDALEIDLANAQINRPLILTVKYDQERVQDPNSLTIGQYHEPTKTWRLVPGPATVDPFQGTVSIELPSVTDAAEVGGGRSAMPLAGTAFFTGTEFRARSDTTATHRGLFAVFQGVPPTNIGYVGPSFNSYNFPNPFSLKSKTLTLKDGGAAGSTLTTEGTLIRYEVPAALSGDVDFAIYTVSGELVRELHEGNRAGGFIYYTPWDGKNASGSEVSSGVYFAVAKVNHQKAAVFKMAVLK